ncbi:MAG: CpaF family protein [Elusimicrobiota bacterium]
MNVSAKNSLAEIWIRPQTRELMANADGAVYIEDDSGRLEKSTEPANDAEKISFLESLTGEKLTFGPARPYADLSAKDGSRIHVAAGPLTPNGGLCLTARKRPVKRPGLDDLVRAQTISEPGAGFLRYAVQNRKNILIAGGTSSGKTTLMNALAAWIDPPSRILVLEDTPELALEQPHVLYLKTRIKDPSGLPDVTLEDLVKNSLRMRPDRILVGECRGAEAFHLLQAMSVGHDGTLCTLHAGSCREALLRLEILTLMAGLDMPARAVRSNIAAALDLVVVMARFADGSRRVIQVQEVTGTEMESITLSPLFDINAKAARGGNFILKATGAVPRFYDDLRRLGAQPPLDFFREN